MLRTGISRTGAVILGRDLASTWKVAREQLSEVTYVVFEQQGLARVMSTGFMMPLVAKTLPSEALSTSRSQSVV